MRILKLFLVAVIFAITSIAQAAAPAFEKGDRVTFIGDSITHAGSYHSNIYMFYATRFPDRPFKYYNCGISGDTAQGTNKRFKTDIAAHQPNVATIMLGMNDAWAWCFTEDEPTEAMLKGRQLSYDLYTTEMDMLAASLAKINTRIIFIKPSIYDQTAKLEKENLIGKNDQLRRFADFIETLAEKYDGSIVDFYTIMSQINKRIQKEDSSATIVGHDRVHPGEQGHFIMSYAFLKAQDMPQRVSSIELNADTGKILKSENCTIELKRKISPDRIAFTCTENALPFPTTKEQAKALQLVPFQDEFNQQLVKINSRKPGLYELKIDNKSIGTYSSDELATGINLSDNRSTPQYQQALEVKTVNNQRLAVISKLRSIALVRYTMISKLDPHPHVPEDDMEALEAALNAQVEKSKGQPWYDYLKSQAETFLEFVPQEDNLRAQEESLLTKTWTINQPKPHHWTLTPVDDKVQIEPL
ncbi:MAG: SGNH/GDSL hydrolase family protein [Planctomycetes bacterium]|nr:SGNH/GDSL hydrolase family protein [Planctomycetota bacterium]